MQQIDSNLQIEFFTTQQANVLGGNSIFKLRLKDYIHQVKDNIAELQAQIDSFTIHYQYKLDQLNFNGYENPCSILHNPSPNDHNLGFIELNKAPADIALQRDNADLLLKVYNDTHEEHLFIIRNWEESRHRLDGIIIAGKLLPVLLNKPLQSFASTDLERLTIDLRKALLQSWIGEQLETFPYKSKTAALSKLFNQIYLERPLSETGNLYQLFDFDSREALVKLHQSYGSNKVQIEASSTEKEKTAQAKIFSLYYAKLVLLHAEYREIFNKFFPQENYDLLFKDFDLNLQNNFPLASGKFKNNIFNPVVLEKVAWAINAPRLDKFIPQNQKMKIENKPLSLEEAALVEARQEIIDQKLLNAKEMQADQAGIEPQVAENRVNVHSIETKGHRIAKAADKASALENERSWLQSVSHWFYGTAVGTVGISIIAYVAWLLRLRWAPHQQNLLPTVAETVMVPLLNEVCSADAASLDKDNHNTNQKENLNSLSGPSTYFEESAAEENNPLANVSSNWDGKGTLIGLDLLTRLATGEKYSNSIGNYSYELLQRERVDSYWDIYQDANKEAIKKGWEEEGSAPAFPGIWGNSEQDCYYDAQETLHLKGSLPKHKSQKQKQAQLL